MKPRLVVNNDALPAVQPETVTFAFCIGPAGILASQNGEPMNPGAAMLALRDRIGAHLNAGLPVFRRDRAETSNGLL